MATIQRNTRIATVLAVALVAAAAFTAAPAQAADMEVRIDNFAFAPQRSLYPTADAMPSAADVAEFLAAHGIRYVYQDAIHSGTLVPWAVEVFRDGDHRLLRVAAVGSR